MITLLYKLLPHPYSCGFYATNSSMPSVVPITFMLENAFRSLSIDTNEQQCRGDVCIAQDVVMLCAYACLVTGRLLFEYF